jgi:hypothetical protein
MNADFEQERRENDATAFRVGESSDEFTQRSDAKDKERRNPGLNDAIPLGLWEREAEEEAEKEKDHDCETRTRTRRNQGDQDPLIG